MNKSVFLTLALFATFFCSQAQETTGEKGVSRANIIKTSPFQFITSTFLLSYERMLCSGNMSLMLTAGLCTAEGRISEQLNLDHQEELQLRYYFLPPNEHSAGGKGFFYFKGMYTGLYAKHRFRDRTLRFIDHSLQQFIYETEQLNEFSGGVVLGTQFAFGNRLFMDFFMGSGIKRSWGRSPKGSSVSVSEPGFSGVIPKIGLQLGVGF